MEPKLANALHNQTVYKGLDDMAEQMSKSKKLWAVIEFKGEITNGRSETDRLPEYPRQGRIDYEIRMTKDAIMDPVSLKPSAWKPGAKNEIMNMMYFSGGFLFIQDLIDHAIMRVAMREKYETEWLANEQKITKTEKTDTAAKPQHVRAKRDENTGPTVYPHFEKPGSWLQEMPYRKLVC